MIIRLFLTWIIVICLGQYANSQTDEFKVKTEVHDNDSSLFLYCKSDSPPVDSLSFFVFDNISWHYDSLNLYFYYFGETLMSTSGNGNNEIRIVYGVKKVHKDRVQQIDRIEFMSNQSFGNFRSVKFHKGSVFFFKNQKHILTMSIHQINRQILEDYFLH
jgi:hypothetical protein